MRHGLGGDLSQLRPAVGRSVNLRRLWICGGSIGDSCKLSEGLWHSADHEPDANYPLCGPRLGRVGVAEFPALPIADAGGADRAQSAYLTRLNGTGCLGSFPPGHVNLDHALRGSRRMEEGAQDWLLLQPRTNDQVRRPSTNDPAWIW